jgi:hypothetical protein
MAAKVRNTTINIPATAFQRIPAVPYRFIPKSATMPKTKPLKMINVEKSPDTNTSTRVAGAGLPALAAKVKIVTPMLANGARTEYVAAWWKKVFPGFAAEGNGGGVAFINRHRPVI